MVVPVEACISGPAVQRPLVSALPGALVDVMPVSSEKLVPPGALVPATAEKASASSGQAESLADSARPVLDSAPPMAVSMTEKRPALLQQLPFSSTVRNSQSDPETQKYMGSLGPVPSPWKLAPWLFRNLHPSDTYRLREDNSWQLPYFLWRRLEEMIFVLPVSREFGYSSIG